MTATTREQPFDQAQASLRASQTFAQDEGSPHYVPVEMEPRRVPFAVTVIAAMAGGAALWLAILWVLGWLAVANAAESRTWVIWDTAANEQYHPHVFTSPTACMTDIAGVKDGTGKRLACVKITKEGE